MGTSSSHKKCLKTKRDKMLLKKKNLWSKKVFSKITKKRRNDTNRLLIHLFMAVFSTQIKIYSFALETFSVIFFLYKRKSWSVVFLLQVETRVIKIIHNIHVNFKSALNLLTGLV